MLVAVLYWIGRRTFGPYKNLSVPEDYLLLVLLLGIVVMGDHLRFVGGLHAETYQAWFASLMAFRPAFPAELADTTTRFALGLAHALRRRVPDLLPVQQADARHRRVRDQPRAEL